MVANQHPDYEHKSLNTGRYASKVIQGKTSPKPCPHRQASHFPSKSMGGILGRFEPLSGHIAAKTYFQMSQTTCTTFSLLIWVVPPAHEPFHSTYRTNDQQGPRVIRRGRNRKRSFSLCVSLRVLKRKSGKSDDRTAYLLARGLRRQVT